MGSHIVTAADGAAVVINTCSPKHASEVVSGVDMAIQTDASNPT